MEDPGERVARDFTASLPHCRDLNMRLISASGGVAEMLLPYDTRLIGDPETGVIHGGSVSVLLDTCGGAAAKSHPEGPRETATMDLRIDYMRPARPGQTIRARAECHHVTRSVAFVRGVAHDDDSTTPVATMTATYTRDGGKGAP